MAEVKRSVDQNGSFSSFIPPYMIQVFKMLLRSSIACKSHQATGSAMDIWFCWLSFLWYTFLKNEQVFVFDLFVIFGLLKCQVFMACESHQRYMLVLK